MQNILDYEEKEKTLKNDKPYLHYTLLVIFAFGLGIASHFFYQKLTYQGIHFSTLGAIFLMTIVSIVLLFRRLMNLSIKVELYYQLQLLSIALAFVGGWTVLYGESRKYLIEQMLISMTIWWAIVAAFGGLVLRIINSSSKKKI